MNLSELIWIPEKKEIEIMLENALDQLKKSDDISYIEEWLVDELDQLECHISNRAGIESGRIKE